MFGPHCSKMDNQRSFAQFSGWDCFQTHYHTPRSLNNPPYVNEETKSSPLWIWHAAYVASANPSHRFKEATRKYLQIMIDHAEQMKIHSIVLHTGATKGKEPKQYLAEAFAFLESLDRNYEKITIELGANLSAINCNPQYVSGHFNWCLDLAHSYAAGITWSILKALIEKSPPRVCHCNFPGSDFWSGRDIHGWRSASTNQQLNKEYDQTLRLLASLKVPLIVEGSGSTASNMTIELSTLRGVLSDGAS